MSYQDYLGVLDSEYDVICDMDEEGLITYLIEGFNATREDARKALFTVGLISEE